jgi:GH15 family glucan-1,4-alpha-glucosidase
MGFRLALIMVVVIGAYLSADAQPHTSPLPYKGYAILGSGTFCAVYSDDARICTKTKLRGIQHFYFNDYTSDYIASTSFDLVGAHGPLSPEVVSTGMKNYFTTSTRTTYARKPAGTVECFVHPEGVVFSYSAKGAGAGTPVQFTMLLRKHADSGAAAALTETRIDGSSAIARYSNGVHIGVAPQTRGCTIRFSDSTLVITAPAGSSAFGNIVLAVGATKEAMFSRLAALTSDDHPEETALRYWEAWLAEGRLPDFKNQTRDTRQLAEAFKRNVYAAQSANINGNVPADITGQFTTNGMPQLYPRDAMMCARVFLETGHLVEARSIISFWTRPGIPKKSPGEFYARYDAFGRAVDAGSGARYDEPEWDANGYLIQLLDMYHARTRIWLAPKEFIYSLADHLARSIDSTGLLYEGGIVEWTGYLPTTNMVCAAALTTASTIARTSQDSSREAQYREAASTITRSLNKTFRHDKHTYMALRFHGEKAADNRSLTQSTVDSLYLWDTTINFGVLWGYEPTRDIAVSNDFFNANTVALGGGMQYFDAVEPGLAGYGHDVFFFTTAAAAQYEARFGTEHRASTFIAWMTSHANIYGLMPERIYLNGSDCSDASPLSWCCAEYALSIYELSRRRP